MVGRCDTTGAPRAVVLAGNFAYVAASEAGLQIFDITSPSAPVWVATADTIGWAYGVMASGVYVYVADGHRGLTVLELRQLSIRSQAGQMEMTWPGAVSGFVLCTTLALDSQDWIQVAASPVLENGVWRVTLPAPNDSHRFCCLKKLGQ